MNEVTSFRHSIFNAIVFVRGNWFKASNYKHFPSDKELSDYFSITPQAFSNIVRGCSSPSGLVLMKILNELTFDQVQDVFSSFKDYLNEN